MKRTKKVQDYLNQLLGRPVSYRDGFVVKGHLVVRENDLVVFDDHNLIVDEGKGLVMDWLASDGYSQTYTISPFGAVVLTNNTSTEQSSDTYGNAVDGNHSDEGVLHIPAWTSVTHVEGALTIQLSATITQAYGNDPGNNHINSVCVVAGTSPTTGGPGEASYSDTGDEKLFSRVHVGDLVKTVDKSFNFSWTFTIQ